MSRLPLVQPEQATGVTAELLATVQKSLGVTARIVKYVRMIGVECPLCGAFGPPEPATLVSSDVVVR
ncbi:hypothetical protein IU474_14575 [Nocardia otitidiscaviarum]|uniref:hypothetical protein n=1 Tax=Nocardia otitidiscaviarum TaxID=1823 RepID=UPI0018961F99|nr:hypothetical protein [Nocardia otitidiscaviarum]MBF6238281.1 hypothetical protein [Nocardia otitidiscaviarum]